MMEKEIILCFSVITGIMGSGELVFVEVEI
jgi:hypothetical protein